MGLGDVKGYIALGIVALLVCGGAFAGMVFNNLNSEVTVDVVPTEGVPGAIGEGKYHKGDVIVLTASVSFGWFFDGWYRTDGELFSEKQTVTFTTTGDFTLTTKSHKGYGVALYGDNGIYQFEGAGSHESGTSTTVKATVATGYTFKGWYDVDGNLVDSRSSYTLKDKTNTTLIAKTNSTKTYEGSNSVSFSSSADFDPDKVDIVVTDRFSGNIVYSASGKSCNLNLKSGMYQWTVKGYLNSGKWYQSTENVVVGTEFVCDYEWYFNEKKYTLSFTVTYSQYSKYCKLNSGNRAPQTASDRLSMVDYDSTFVKNLAGELSTLSKGMTDNARANFVLKFVQLCTKYQTDIERYNQVEHWKYPLETIFERSGDCEDTSILYSALMKAMGYNSCLLLFSDHAASGVGLSSVPGWDKKYYDVGGVKYYFCETTSDTQDVGDPTSGYDKATVLVVK